MAKVIANVNPDVKTTKNTVPDATNHTIVIDTEPPWVCSVCYAVVPDQKLTKCPKAGCHTKRLMPEKTDGAATKNLIAKDALKIIEGEGGKVDEEKRKAEIEQWEKTRDDAKSKGWAIIQEYAEKRLEERKPAKSTELEAAKGTRTVISARVTLVNSHENKTKALETKCINAAKAIEKHKEQLEKALDLERERHSKTMKAHQEDFARMIKEQEQVIKRAEEELRTAKVEYEQADEKINGYISKHLPAEPDITPETLNK